MSRTQEPPDHSLNERIQAIVNESLELKRRFFTASAEQIIAVVEQIEKAFKAGNKVLLFGNGGSAADCQHIAAEFVNRFLLDRPGLPAIALTTNNSALTSISNDLGYDHVFSRQLEALGQPGDVAIGISTSGASPSVIAAIERGKQMGLVTVGFTGRDGGKMSSLVDHLINVPHQSTARIQEVHIMIGHIICELVDEKLFKTTNK